MAQMFARMDRIMNNPSSHIDCNQQGIRGKFTIHLLLDLMMEKHI
jgi:hypothetical protein